MPAEIALYETCARVGYFSALYQIDVLLSAHLLICSLGF
jgi:hypothetical protein